MSRSGIRNNGNECFMNSSFQILASSPFIQEFMTRYKSDDTRIFAIINKFNLGKFKAVEIKEECTKIIREHSNSLDAKEKSILEHIINHSADIFIYIAFKDIINKLSEKKIQVINNSLFHSIGKELTTEINYEHLFNGDQHDPHEFICYLLDRLHKSKQSKVKISLPPNIDELDIYSKLYHTHFKARYENDYSYFVKNFYYYMLNCVECFKCKNKTYEVCPNESLCVSIPTIESQDNISLDDCLNDMFKVEIIDYKCEKCGNNEENRIEKKILSKPKTLIIKIKRYIQQNTFMGIRLVKNNKMVYYPDIININQHICGQKSCNYELYGIINHTGGLNGGHYYSFVKELDSITGKHKENWISCNDSRVNNITDQEAMTSQNAYILFYNLIQ